MSGTTSAFEVKHECVARTDFRTKQNHPSGGCSFNIQATRVSFVYYWAIQTGLLTLFCPASLKSFGCFYIGAYFFFFFFAMEGSDSEFANFTLPTLKAFLEARSQNVSGNKQ